MKVKVTIRFRGREVTYPEIALEDLKEIAEELKDVAIIETAPSMEGRSMNLILAPLKEKEKKASSEKKPNKKIKQAEKAEEKQVKKAK